MASVAVFGLHSKTEPAGELMIALTIIAGYSSSLVIETGVFDIYIYYFFAAVGFGIWALQGLAMSRMHLALIGFVILHLFGTALLALSIGRQESVALGIRQVFAVVAIYGSMFHLLRNVNLGVTRLYGIYLRCGVWFAALGVCLLLVLLADSSLQDPIRLFLPRWTTGFWNVDVPRLVSIANEPASALILLAPLVLEAIGRILGASYRLNVRDSVLVLIAAALTISPLLIVALLYSLLVWSMGSLTCRKLVVGILIVLGVAFLSQQPDIMSRLNIVKAIEGDFENISLYTLATNSVVASTAFLDSLFLGFGLGSHEVSYEMYSPPLLQGFLELNQKDANSLFLRLLSELGLFGLIPILLFGRLLLKAHRAGGVGISVAGSAGLVLALFLLRQGNYLQFPLVFFTCLLHLGYWEQNRGARAFSVLRKK